MPPIVDHDQRRQALDPHNSFIVQAPAGSGKTELLTQRYLALLATAKVPEEIIAITFTRKAAAEMRARILEALQDVIENGVTHDDMHIVQRRKLAQAALERDKLQNWQILLNPNRLRIQTIDALCASLTRQMPVLSRFGAQPDIAADPELLYSLAAREVLATLESDVPWTDKLADLLLHLNNEQNEIEALFCNMLARRDQWLPHVVGIANASEKRQLLENGLLHAINDSLVKLIASIPQQLIPSIVELTSSAAQQLIALESESAIVCCAELAELPSDQPADLAYWCGIAEFLLTKEDEWRKQSDKRIGILAPSSIKNPAEKARLTAIKNNFSALLQELIAYPLFRQNLAAVRNLPPPQYTEQQWKIITALLELLPILVAQLHVLFQEHGAVDYIEIVSSALQALGAIDAPTDLALRLDYQIRHFLVDEFQDTSLTQLKLLEHLTAGWQAGEGRTLFLVGDPMQSIYRFRKAEVGLFLQARSQGIGNLTLKPLSLSVNFRSTPTVVNWVNSTFSLLMPQQEDLSCGAVSYAASVANKEISPQSEIGCHALSSNNATKEAENIAQLIKNIHAQDAIASVAILVRSRNHLLEILPALRTAGIAYRAVEIETLNSKPVIQDLFALTRALSHLADRIAWLAILRAPWCGLTLTDLHALVGPQPYATLWDRLQLLDSLALSVDGRMRAKKLLLVLKQSLTLRGRVTLAQWVEGAWLALGGPACLTKSTDLDDAAAFFKLLANWESGSEDKNIFLLEKKLATLYAAADNQAETRVEVMTIHKAKGLEFDAVILPGLHRSLTSDARQLLLSMERLAANGVTDLLLAPIKTSYEEQDAIYHYLYQEEQQRAEYETLRLLYVAATRAKKSLYLFGALSNGRTETSLAIPSKNSLLAALWPALAEDFLADFVPEEKSIDINPETVSKSPLLKHLATSWGLPATAAGVVLDFNERTETNHNKNTVFPWRNDAARQIGIVIHRFLQEYGLNGNTKIPDSVLISSLLRQAGVPQDQITASVNVVEQALQKTLNDQRGRWILNHHHADSKVEYALTALFEQKATRVVIDRTFIDEEGNRWIIDYKTTDYQGDNLTEFLATEAEQHRRQLKKYARVMQLLGPQPIRLGLYFPLISAWYEYSYSEMMETSCQNY